MSGRLSDDDINNAVSLSCAASLEDVFDGEDILAMAREIQERRAADLTQDDLATVREMLTEFEANDGAWEGGCEDVIAVCRKILAAHGGES